MAESLPAELAGLLASADDISREKTWRVFLDIYSPLILHAARSASKGYDEGMDAYTAALDALRADGFRKLRGYSADPRSRFSTWLVVVVRRICIDLQREKFGRLSAREKAEGISEERAARHRLARLATAAIDLDSLPDSHGKQPDEALEIGDMNERVECALATLDDRDRLLLTLRFVDDLPAKKIAELQGWPDHTSVYRRINQITAMLRKKLTDSGVDSPAP